jgi:uncharacterized protein with PIN domain
MTPPRAAGPAHSPADRPPAGCVWLRCYASLNDFLPPDRRQARFAQPLAGRAAVKDVIEAAGIPHPEVDLILVNGAPAGFARLVRAGDAISVYPAFTALDIAPLGRLQPAPLSPPRFVLDTHLGKLAAYLRLLGFDTLYRNDADDETLARLAAAGPRLLLTQDRGLLKRGAVTYGYCVRASAPRQQLREVARRFDLLAQARPFSRCARCNGRLATVDKAAVLTRLPPRTRHTYDEFSRCQDCGGLYWPGSHVERLRRLIAELRQEEPAR